MSQTRRDMMCLPSALNSLTQLTSPEAGMRVPSNRRTLAVFDSNAAQKTPVHSAISHGSTRFRTPRAGHSPKPMKIRYVLHAIPPAVLVLWFVAKLIAPPMTLPEFRMADQIPRYRPRSFMCGYDIIAAVSPT